MSKVKDIIEAYELGWTNGIRSSNQSACPAAGCQTDADQGEFAIMSREDLIFFVGYWRSKANRLEGELAAVARRPADTAGVLDKALNSIDCTVKNCRVRLDQMEDEDPGRIRIVRRIKDLKQIRWCLEDIQNQSPQSGQGPAR